MNIQTSQHSYFSCLVKSAWNKPALFAEKLHLAMKVKLQRNSWNVFQFVHVVTSTLSAAHDFDILSLYLFRYFHINLKGL